MRSRSVKPFAVLFLSVFAYLCPNTQAYIPAPKPKAQTTLDIGALALEVTQGVQDLNNSVRLVANKRTFVRLYAATNGDEARTTAVLAATAGDRTVNLSPVNQDGLATVVADPSRLVLAQSFVFELPDGFRAGTVSLRGVVNPVIENVRPNPDPVESDYNNNAVTANVRFEVVPPVNLVLYNVGYRDDNGNVRYCPDKDLPQMVDWMRRAWPVSQINFVVRRDFIGDGLPECRAVNSWMMSKRIWDLQNANVPFNTRYYGMVSDLGGFMRGCANGLPGFASSGPTGAPRNNTSLLGNWDTDGSYGDWYGAHEVAHNFGRFHAEFCGAQAGRPFPNAGGSISPTTGGNDHVVGFDLGTFEVYGSNWTDNMAYCARQWVSRFTYHGLMDAVQNNLVPSRYAQARDDAQETRDRLLVVGGIDLQTNVVDLDPMFIIPAARDVEPRAEGGFAIVLRDADGAALARYPFTPETTDEETATTDQDVPLERNAFISELVPFVEGTTQVDIEGPGGTVLKTVKASAGAPSVKIVSPNGGETLDGEEITLRWEASDADGDTLFFNIQYSPDDGKTWEMIDQFVTGTSTVIDTDNLPGGAAAQFRVWASDGIHTSSDVVDADIRVPNNVPEVKILSPVSGASIVEGATLALVGEVYDADEGRLDGQFLKWTSDLDGNLGAGALVTATNLRAGVHTITLTVDDGDGAVVRNAVKVEVKKRPGAPSDTQAPTVKVLSPNGGEALKRGRVFTIRWESSDNTGVANHDIALSKDSGATFAVTIATGLPGSARTFDFTPPASGEANSKKASIRVSAKDAAGNTGSDTSDATFKVK